MFELIKSPVEYSHRQCFRATAVHSLPLLSVAIQVSFRSVHSSGVVHYRSCVMVKLWCKKWSILRSVTISTPLALVLGLSLTESTACQKRKHQPSCIALHPSARIKATEAECKHASQTKTTARTAPSAMAYAPTLTCERGYHRRRLLYSDA